MIPKYERFDLNHPLEEIENKNVNEIVEEISKSFNDYLGQLNIFAATKSALMGPVGKILEQAKVKGLDAEFLKGYGISTHKNTIKVPLHSDVLKPFEDGIDLLSKLLQKVPRHMRPKVIEIISYKVYYRREKANVEFWESWRRSFEEFLKEKFKNVETVIKECELETVSEKQEIKDFQGIMKLRKTLRTEKLQDVVDEFNKSRKEIILEEEGEEE
ncbi:MAG: hypothetical protein SVO01_00905 [Thermotogota bacterium]|nr:hypothetical protein [Thermotogota bacterium]